MSIRGRSRGVWAHGTGSLTEIPPNRDTAERNPLTWDEFDRVELRVGTIVEVTDVSGAKVPAYRLRVDLGPCGIKTSSARITKLYTKDELVGRQVLCVTNFAPRQIASVRSEVLVTGFYVDDARNEVVLASVERPVPNGARLA